MKLFFNSPANPFLLKRKLEAGAISGTSDNQLYENNAGTIYFVKQPKPRKTRDIFKRDAYFNQLLSERDQIIRKANFNPYTEEPDEETRIVVDALPGEDRLLFEQLQANIGKYTVHVEEIMVTHAIIELIAPRICAAIMGNLLIAPQNELAIVDEKLVIISPAVPHFVEFLSNRPVFSKAKTPTYWLSNPAPSFKDLNLSVEEARLLGCAYFIALLIGHNDLVNNIRLSNLGYVRDNDKLTLCIVDWGNTSGIGFDGLTSEEGAFLNSQFIGEEPSSFSYSVDDISSFKHLMPFDEIVYPFLPRQIVPELFNLSSNDLPELREAQRQGFFEACERAETVLEQLPNLVCTVLRDVLHGVPLNGSLVKRLFPETRYPTAISLLEKQAYNLPNVIQGRLRCLHHIKLQIQDHRSLRDIAETQLGTMKKSPFHSEDSFFNQTTEGKNAANPGEHDPVDSQPILFVGGYF